MTYNDILLKIPLKYDSTNTLKPKPKPKVPGFCTLKARIIWDDSPIPRSTAKVNVRYVIHHQHTFGHGRQLIAGRVRIC